MKKLIFIISACLVFIYTSSAQTEEQYKATSGITTEVGFNPFASDWSMFQVDYMKFRWFFKPEYAFSLGISANYSSENSDEIELPVHGNREANYFSFGINPGFERHFKGTGRLSPFLGAELNFYIYHSTNTIEYDTITQLNQIGDEVIYGKTDYRESDYKSVGAGLLAGTDYFISKNIYLGVEFGYHFYYFFPRKNTRKVDGKEINIISSDYSGYLLNASANGLLRLGWKF